MDGIVTCIKHGPSISDNAYFVLHGDEEGLTLSLHSSNMTLNVGDTVEADFGAEAIAGFLGDDGPAIEKFALRAHRWAEANILNGAGDSGIVELDAVTKKMNEKLCMAAKIFARKLACAAPIIVRFHNDADGSSGAYALYKSLEKFFQKELFSAKPKVIWKMHRSIAYSQIDAEEDTLTVNNYTSLEKPLLLVIDFGTSEGTNYGLERIRDDFDIIWLDHHPLEPEAMVKDLENYISPWAFGGDSSYTAGFLACQFSKFFSEENQFYIEDASMVGDYSKYARNTDRGIRIATVLDLLTSDKTIAFGTRNYLTPSEIDQVLNDEVKFIELNNYAVSKLEESIDSAFKIMKKYNAREGEVYLVDFDAVRDPASTDRFPLPGRFASKLLTSIDKRSDKPKVLILHFGRFISMRVSDNAKNMVDVSALARQMKMQDDNIDSGGGHSSAASIKLIDDAEKKEVINSIINVLKEKL